MVFPCVTVAYYYSYEARAHAIVLGFCGLALVSWQWLTSSSRHRLVAAFVLFLALSCALLTHSYAFLLFIPLTVGELTRAWRSRRIDPLVWDALALAGTMILVSVPLVRAVKSTVGSGQFLPAPPRSSRYVRPFVRTCGRSPDGRACAYLSRYRDGVRVRSLKSTLDVHEWATVLTFLVIPIVDCWRSASDRSAGHGSI